VKFLFLKEKDIIKIENISSSNNENLIKSKNLININKGNIYNTTNIVHCVALDFQCYGGFAAQIATYYDISIISKRDKSIQLCDIITYSDEDQRNIINLITKMNTSDKPVLKDIIQTFKNLNQYCITNNIYEINFPKICCGLDGFDWNIISKHLMENVNFPSLNLYSELTYDFHYLNAITNRSKHNNQYIKITPDNILNFDNICVLTSVDSSFKDVLNNALHKIKFTDLSNCKIGETYNCQLDNYNIFYLIIKKDCKSTFIYDYLNEALISLLKLCLKNSIKEIHFSLNNIHIKDTYYSNTIKRIREIFALYDIIIHIHLINNTKIKPIEISSTVMQLFNFQTILTITESITFIDTFQNGHCALQSVYETLKPQHNIADFKNIVYQNTVLAINENIRNPSGITLKNVDEYFYKMIWNTTEISSFVIEVISYIFQTDIQIIFKNIKIYALNDIYFDHAITIYYIGDGAHGHYTSKMIGGSISKFPKLCDETFLAYHEYFKYNVKNVIELSCAPGYLIDHINTVCKLNTIGLVYDNKNIKLTVKNKNTTYYSYDDKLLHFDLYNDKFAPDQTLLISDAADSTSSECVLDNIIRKLKLNEHHSMLIKFFSYTTELYEFITHFKKSCIINCNNDTEELYILLLDYSCIKIQDIKEIKNKFYKNSYNFKIPKSNLIDKFVEHFYNSDFKIFKTYYKPIRKSKIFNVHIFSGYASCGKTTKAIKYYTELTSKNNAKFVMIAPTKELSLYHTDKFNCKSYTPHAFFKMYNNEKYVLIDEISQFPIEFFHMVNMCFNCEIVLLGDVDQTPFVNYIDTVKFTTCKSIGIYNNLSLVHSIPQDATEIINHAFKYSITSTSKVVTSIFNLGNQSIDLLKDYVHIAFNNDTVKLLRSKGLNAYTITAVTGQRIPLVAFHIDSHALNSDLPNRTEWIYVALSRHTERLVIVDNPLERIVNIGGAKIEILSVVNNIPIYTESKHLPEQYKLNVVEQKIPEHSVNIECITNILDKIIKPHNPQFPQFSYLESDQIDNVKSGSIKIKNIGKASSENFTIHGFRLPINSKYVKEQFNVSRRSTLSCMITRYLSKTPLHKGKNLQIQLKYLVEGYKKMIYSNQISNDRMKEDLFVPNQELLFHASDYLTALSKKVGPQQKRLATVLDMDFDLLGDFEIAFFQKKQAKFDSKVSFDTSTKVGQGVASVAKNINVLFSAYARALIKKIPELAKNNNSPLKFFTHGSEKDLNIEYLKSIEYIVNKGKYNDYNWVCNDFSEWDAHYNNVNTEFICILFKCMGMDERLIDFYKRNRQNWRMVCFMKDGTITIKGHEKQFSGGPLTILENTLFNAIYMNVIFDFEKLIISNYKGDDSAILAKNVSLTSIGKQFIDDNGMLLKKHITKIGEFAGYFLTPYGLFPDVVRQTAKFISKTYKDQNHFNEALLSVQEKVSVVNNVNQWNFGCTSIALHYNLHSNDTKTLFTFLQQSRKIKFCDLSPVSLEILKQPNVEPLVQNKDLFLV